LLVLIFVNKSKEKNMKKVTKVTKKVHFYYGLVMTLFSLLSVSTVQAHHSFSMYDRSKTEVFTGVVTSVNPGAVHLEIFFAPMNEARDGVLRDENGEPQIWSVEMGSAGMVARYGISTTGFSRGTVFSAAMHPSRDGKFSGVLVRDKKNQSILVKCPDRNTPVSERHCDSVDGATSHGEASVPW
jgi:hypothetical protein